jgi:hypothetical protein
VILQMDYRRVAETRVPRRSSMMNNPEQDHIAQFKAEERECNLHSRKMGQYLEVPWLMLYGLLKMANLSTSDGLLLTSTQHSGII